MTIVEKKRIIFFLLKFKMKAFFYDETLTRSTSDRELSNESMFKYNLIRLLNYLITNSSYWSQYVYFNVSAENSLYQDQTINFFTLFTCLLDLVWILWGEIKFLSMVHNKVNFSSHTRGLYQYKYEIVRLLQSTFRRNVEHNADDLTNLKLKTEYD